jgi:hypothetical protein
LAKAIPIAPRSEDPHTYEAAFATARQVLDEGDLLGIFPEGSITRDGELQPFKGGVLKILQANPVPVVPIGLSNLWGSFFSRIEQGRAMVKPFRRGSFSRVTLRAGPPIAPQDATLELMPEQMTTINTHAWFDYRRWAFMNGAEYFTLVQPDAPECAELGFRECGNITANTSQVGAALREVFRHTAMPPIGQTPATSSSLYEFSADRETRSGAARRSARWNVVPGAYVRLECIHTRHEAAVPAAAPVSPGVQTAVGPLPARSGTASETLVRICAVVWRLPGKLREMGKSAAKSRASQATHVHPLSLNESLISTNRTLLVRYLEAK